MKIQKLLQGVALGAFLMAATFAMASNNDPMNKDYSEPVETIVGVAASNDNFSTLVAAVKAADLVATLNSNGPFTVFAPTNEAFAALPEGTVESLLKPENKAALAKILTRHAAPGSYKTMYLKDGMTLYMATGDYLPVVVKDGEYYVGGAKILGTVECSNGIVHVVDKVILPE